MDEPDPVQRRRGPLAPLGQADAGVQEPVGHVVQGGGVLGEEELLEHEADAGGAQRGDSRRSPRAAASSPVIRTVPALGRSSEPIRCSNVDLPDPDGPVIASSSPGSTVKLTPRTASTGGRPG